MNGQGQCFSRWTEVPDGISIRGPSKVVTLMNRPLLLVSVLMASAALELTFAQAAYATHVVPCFPSTPYTLSESFHAGDAKSATNPTGVRGTLEGQSLSLCTAPTNQDRGSSEWIAVTAGLSSVRGLDIVQAGFINCSYTAYLVCTSGMKYFWAWGRDPATPGCSGTLEHPPVPISLGTWGGTSKEFIVALSSGYWKVYIGGVLQDQLSATNTCWARSQVLWMGEAWNKGDQIGGVAGNKYTISAARYQTVAGGTWLNPSLAAPCDQTYNPFYCEVGASDQVNTWTAH